MKGLISAISLCIALAMPSYTEPVFDLAHATLGVLSVLSNKPQKMEAGKTEPNEEEQAIKKINTPSADVTLLNKTKPVSSKVTSVSEISDLTEDAGISSTHNNASIQEFDGDNGPNPSINSSTEFSVNPPIESQPSFSDTKKHKTSSPKNLLKRAKNKLIKIKSSLRRQPRIKEVTNNDHNHLDPDIDRRKENTAQVNEPAYQKISDFDDPIYEVIPEPTYEVISPQAPTTPRPKEIKKTADRKQPAASNNDYDRLDTGTYDHLDRKK